MAEPARVLGILFAAELLLIVALMVLNTYFLTRQPVLQHMREIYFINSHRFRRAWHLIIAAMSVFLFMQAIEILADAQALTSAPGIRELFLVAFAGLVVAAFVDIVNVFERYVPRLGSDDAVVVERIRLDLRRRLQEPPTTAALLPTTSDVYRGREALGPYVGIAHYRGVVLGITRFLDQRYGQLGDALLDAVGRQQGRAVAQDLLREQSAASVMDTVLDALRSAHVGIPSREDEGLERRRILLKECAACGGMALGGSGPQCHYLTGLFAGLHEVLWAKTVDAREVRCWALGDHVCEFDVQVAAAT